MPGGCEVHTPRAWLAYHLPTGAWMCGSASQLWREQRQAWHPRVKPSAWRAAKTGCLGNHTQPRLNTVCGWGLLDSATQTCAQHHIATSVSCGLEVCFPLLNVSQVTAEHLLLGLGVDCIRENKEWREWCREQLPGGSVSGLAPPRMSPCCPATWHQHSRQYYHLQAPCGMLRTSSWECLVGACRGP